jgi:hypothetical protein
VLPGACDELDDGAEEEECAVEGEADISPVPPEQTVQHLEPLQCEQGKRFGSEFIRPLAEDGSGGRHRSLATWMTWFLKSDFSLSFLVLYSRYRMLMRYAVQLPINP